MSSKPQRWEWAIGLKLEELNDQHLQTAYKLNWDNLCKFDSCRKNCKRVLCLACFDRSWIDNDNANNSGYDYYDSTNFDQKRADLKTFVGLKNLGATCYVNCLLQLWFHNPALRKAIYEWDPNGNDKVEPKKEPNNNINDDDNSKTSQSEASQQQKKSILIHNNNSLIKSSTNINIKRPTDEIESEDSSIGKKKNKISSQNSNTKPVSVSQETKLLSPSSKCDLATTTSTSTANTTSKNTSSTKIATVSNNTQIKTQSSKDPIQRNPIEQLQLIFARLQFTNKKSIDPFNFIDSLALNAAEQQDAQEFGNLFMEFLEKSFANQNNSFVSNIIQNQFCGRYSYATICDTCKHSSLSDSNFYELDLSIQDLETLHDCLNEFFRPVPLDGKYNCSRCEKAQSAHRKIILKSLPPTLNLQLLRFVYDVQRNVRQKLNSYIIFPEVLDMNPFLSANAKSTSGSLDLTIKNSYLSNGTLRPSKSNIYILSAVLIHRGSSPHSGHYIAHIKDRVTKDWYKFNDDSVERIGPQLQVSTDGENITIVEDKSEPIKINDPNTGRVTKLESKSLKSKTAYMLVYQAQDNEALSYPSDHSENWMLPLHLQTAVASENSKSEELFESLEIAKEVDQQLIIARKEQIRNIYEKLVCRDPSDKFEFIDKNWLQEWLTNSSSNTKFPPIDNSSFLCCHDKLDFRKIDQVKCVRSEGADLLYEKFGGGPRLRDAMCKKCVELEVRLIQLKERMKEDQKYITSQAKFKLEAGYDFEDAYIVGKNSYRDWQAMVMAQFKKSYPELLSRKKSNPNNQQNSSDEDDNKKETNNLQDSAKREEETNSNNNNNNNSDSESDDEAIEKFVFNSDILCDHDQLVIDTSAWRLVPKEVWNIFKHYFGNDPARPLIERNANTLMCPDCKKQEEEQQQIGDKQKMVASEQKSKLLDLFHNRKRGSWVSMLPEDVYYALDRDFLTKWQKFIRNPCTQPQPKSGHSDKLVCSHGRSLYNFENSNPVMPECPFVLIKKEELDTLKEYYNFNNQVKFSIDPALAEETLKEFRLALVSTSNSSKKSTLDLSINKTPTTTGNSGDNNIPEASTQIMKPDVGTEANPMVIDSLSPVKQEAPGDNALEEIDLTQIDWSSCIISEPDFCCECHEMLKQDELQKLLNYETATIYITKVENPTPVHRPKNNNNSVSILTSSKQSTPITGNNTDSNNLDCDKDTSHINNNNTNTNHLQQPQPQIETHLSTNNNNKDQQSSDIAIIDEQMAYPNNPFKKRKKGLSEDEANDFVPPGVVKQSTAPNVNPNSILRRTTRRNRNREQAYTIKPTQTLLQLKKDIFDRCQVLPSDQRLFLNDVLLDNNEKTMSELRIVPNCSLKLEVDRPISDNIDMIEDESSSRKSCAQPETGFKGSLLLSNSYHC